MSARRRRYLLLLAVVVTAVAIVVAAGLSRRFMTQADPGSLGDRDLLLDRPSEAVDANRVTVTDGLHGFTATVRVNHDDLGLELDTTDVTCHGGMIVVAWHVGNLEPTVPDTGIHLSARLDGETIGSLVRGATRGIWDDDPTTIHAVTICSPGRHRLTLAIVSVTGEWGIPYVGSPGASPSPDLLVNRGFILTEFWDG